MLRHIHFGHGIRCRIGLTRPCRRRRFALEIILDSERVYCVSGITSAELSIKDLLCGKYKFRIPRFQRPYSWTEIETRQLLDDLTMVLLDDGRDLIELPFFFGTMILRPIDVRQVPREVEVIDGQQRLITVSILLAVLRDLLPQRHADELQSFIASRGSFQIDMRERDAQLFADAVQKPGATRRAWTTEPSELAQRNILANRQLLFRVIQQISSEQRARIAACLLQHCRVLVLETPNPNYAYEIFLRTNDRGRPLSEGDMVRGEIIGPLNAEQRQRYDAILEQIEEYQVGDDQRRKRYKTFFTHLRAVYGLRNRMIDDLRELITGSGGPLGFNEQIMRPLADAYVLITASSARQQLPGDLQRLLVLLSWYAELGDDDWVAPAMQWVAKFGANLGVTGKFLVELDRYVHVMLALGWGRPARTAFFDRLNRVILGSPVGRPPDPIKLFELSAEKQRTALRRIARKLHVIDSQTCRLVLLRIDHYVSRRDVAHYSQALATDKYTIEHIVPRGRSDAPAWAEQFPVDRQRLVCAESMGNLALVTEEQNKRADRQSFQAKCEIFFAGGKPKSPFLLTNALAEQSQWGRQQILARQDRMMTAVKEMWRLKGECDNSYLLKGR